MKAYAPRPQGEDVHNRPAWLLLLRLYYLFGMPAAKRPNPREHAVHEVAMVHITTMHAGPGAHLAKRLGRQARSSWFHALSQSSASRELGSTQSACARRAAPRQRAGTKHAAGLNPLCHWGCCGSYAPNRYAGTHTSKRASTHRHTPKRSGTWRSGQSSLCFCGLVWSPCTHTWAMKRRP